MRAGHAQGADDLVFPGLIVRPGPNLRQDKWLARRVAGRVNSARLGSMVCLE
jgi:hypothetical protein